MYNFASKKCIACEGGVPPLDKETALKYLAEIPGWNISEDGKNINRIFEFKNFNGSMVFVNKVAETAESEGHHPDIHIFYDKVKLVLETHAIGGLSDNDFILAAKINRLTD